MRYFEVPGEKTYCVFHTEGTGVQGDPVMIKEFLKSFDSAEEAYAFGNARYPKPTGWENEGFTVDLNTLTPRGKKLYEIFKVNMEKMVKEQQENPDKFSTYKVGDIEITIAKNDKFDS